MLYTIVFVCHRHVDTVMGFHICYARFYKFVVANKKNCDIYQGDWKVAKKY